MSTAISMPKCILVDIGGTTSSLTYIKSLIQEANSILKDLIMEAQKQLLNDGTDSVNILQSMIAKLSIPFKKKIEGIIISANIKNDRHVFPDVPIAFNDWVSKGVKLYVYSACDATAQKYYFAHTIEGDLTTFILDYFDTNIGLKNEPKSYITIAEMVGERPENFLYLTDVAEEAEAAKLGGMHPLVVLREDNAPLDEAYINSFQTITNFFDIKLMETNNG